MNTTVEFYDNVLGRYREVEVECSVLCGDSVGCSACPGDNGCLIVREELPAVDPKDDVPF